jgi:hyperosmotically inducible periplasmic protein
MQIRKTLVAMVAVLVCLATAAGRPATAAGRSDPKDLITQVRKDLMRLPYYGVFDFLVFSVNGPSVTLSGQVYNASIKKDAEREVKRIAGVENVVNNIEVLPVSGFDDDIRWAAFRAIYHDASLSRYMPGGGWVPRGRMWRFDRPFDPLGPGMRFPGQEPLGNYPIHIIVKAGRITLEGVVDNEMDKNLAGMRARGVSGAFAIDDELQIEK